MSSQERTNVLLIEDNPGDARLLELALRQLSEQGVRWTVVARISDALSRLQAGGFDVVITDLALPDSAGATTVTRLRNARPGIPIVVLTATQDERLHELLTGAGAAEVLEKGPVSPDKLLTVLTKATGRTGPTGRKTPRPDPTFPAGAEGEVPTAGTASIDPRALAEIRKFAGNGEGDALVREVVGMFVAQGESLVHDLVGAIRQGHADGVRATSHNLRSLCLQVGAQDLARTAGELERRGEEGDLRDAPDLGQRAQEEFRVAQAALEQALRRA